jgi:hypothetical protein
LADGISRLGIESCLNNPVMAFMRVSNGIFRRLLNCLPQDILRRWINSAKPFGSRAALYACWFAPIAEAEEAVSKRVGAMADVVLEAQTLIKGLVFDEMEVKSGAISQW